MAIKMIVSDLDGTMLNSSYRIPPENVAAVREAMARGIIVTLATGRMYRSAKAYADELGLTAPIITYNGAVVKKASGELISGDFIPPQTVKAVLEYCLAAGCYVQLYCDGEYYYAERTETARQYERACGVDGHAVGQDGLIERLQHVEKLLLVGRDPLSADKMALDLNIKFGGQIAAMKSTAVYIEVIRPSVSKAGAMLRLAKSYGIKAEEIMALGDSDNDLSMMMAAGCPVAMGNATENVRQAAKYISADCEAGGVAEAIRKYALGGEP